MRLSTKDENVCFFQNRLQINAVILTDIRYDCHDFV